MRKLHLQMQMSVDGFVSTGPNDEQKWVTWAWAEIKQYVLDLADSADTEIIGRKLAEKVNKLKIESGKNIIVYGGSSFFSALLKERLIDEVHLFVNPVALGRGVPVFSDLENWQALRLKNSITYDSGIVLLNYQMK